MTPPGASTSFSGARPDMEHTRLGLNTANCPVSLTLQQRLWQIAVLGKTGMGKSTLLRSIIFQDIAPGDGLLLIDPHGTLADECLALVPLDGNRPTTQVVEPRHFKGRGSTSKKQLRPSDWAERSGELGLPPGRKALPQGARQQSGWSSHVNLACSNWVRQDNFDTVLP